MLKKFLKYMAVLVIASIGTTYLLDIFITYIHNNLTIRSKVDWVRDLNKSDHYDYMILGSSRCIQYIDPTIILKETASKGLNLCYASATPFDVKLMLKELVERTTVKSIYIQVDHSWNENTPSHLSRVGWLPYLKEKKIFENLEMI